MVEISIHDQDINCAVPKHWHRSIELSVPIHGSTEAWIDGNVFRVFPGHFLIVNSSQIHSCRCVKPHEEYYGFAIQIRYDFLETCFRKIGDYQFVTDYEGDHLSEIHSCISDLIDTYKIIDDFSDMKLTGISYQLVYLLLKHTLVPCESVHGVTEKNRSRLVEILDYMDDHYLEIEEVSSLADHFHISYGYMARLFQTSLNMTISDYLNSVRIRHIEQDLIATDETVSDLCLRHGYANTKSFYREFNEECAKESC